MTPRTTIEAFDRFLSARLRRFPWKSDAARAFAAEVRFRSGALDDDWLNNGPASLICDLPPGWEQRLQPAFAGVSIELRSLGRDPDWPQHVRDTLRDLQERLGHGV